MPLVLVTALTVLLRKLGMAEADVDSLELGWDLAEALVVPFAKQRSLVGLSRKTAMKLSLLLEETEPKSQPRGSSTCSELSITTHKRKHRHVCISEPAGAPGYKAEKDKLHKIKTICSKCGKTTCR